MHPSLLPEYRGAFPGEWAILRGERKTGVTILTMDEGFDTGDILAQEEVAIDTNDTKETLYEKLFREGAGLLVKTITKESWTPTKQPKGEYFYARKLTREDGFIEWEKFDPKNEEVQVKFRALFPWPGVWTITPDNKRLKLVSLSPSVQVQFEGKTPQSWTTIHY